VQFESAAAWVVSYALVVGDFSICITILSTGPPSQPREWGMCIWSTGPSFNKYRAHVIIIYPHNTEQSASVPYEQTVPDHVRQTAPSMHCPVVAGPYLGPMLQCNFMSQLLYLASVPRLAAFQLKRPGSSPKQFWVAQTAIWERQPMPRNYGAPHKGGTILVSSTPSNW